MKIDWYSFWFGYSAFAWILIVTYLLVLAQ